MSRRRLPAAFVAAVALILSGCTDPPPAIERLPAAHNTLEHASRVAALHAPVELSVAQYKLLYAEQALSRKDYDIAERLAEQAEVEATLVLAMSLIRQEIRRGD